MEDNVIQGKCLKFQIQQWFSENARVGLFAWSRVLFHNEVLAACFDSLESLFWHSGHRFRIIALFHAAVA